MSNDASWLSVGAVSATIPATLTVSVEPNGRGPGNYTGVITLAGLQPDGSIIPVGIPVTLSVFP